MFMFDRRTGGVGSKRLVSFSEAARRLSKALSSAGGEALEPNRLNEGSSSQVGGAADTVFDDCGRRATSLVSKTGVDVEGSALKTCDGHSCGILRGTWSCCQTRGLCVR